MRQYLAWTREIFSRGAQRRFLWLRWVLVGALGWVGCGDDDGVADTGITDAGTDGGEDSGATDGGNGGDSGSGDAGSRDAGSDGGAVTCDATYEGDDAWTGRLVVEEGARLCAYTPDEMAVDGSALPDTIANKSVITLMPGNYALPTESVDAAFRIPMCVTDGDAAPVAASSASSVMVEEGGWIPFPSGVYVRATMGVGGEDFELNLVRTLEASEVRLGTTPVTDHLLGAYGARGERFYTSCNLQPNQCWDLDLGDLGTARLEEFIWAASPGHGFAVATRFSGTIAGVAMDIDAYEQLSTAYNRHAFGRYHFLRFDSPTADGHCGLRLDTGESDGEFGHRVAYADCDGNLRGEWGSVRATGVDCGR